MNERERARRAAMIGPIIAERWHLLPDGRRMVVRCVNQMRCGFNPCDCDCFKLAKGMPL